MRRDQRRLTGNGSALEVVLHDYALYKFTFILLYFTTECSLRVWKLACSQLAPIPEIGSRKGIQRTKTLGLILALVCVAAAGLLVVIQ